MAGARRYLWVIACLALISLTACAYLREAIGLGPQRPKVQLTEIAVTKASLAAVDLLLTLRVDNPNSFDLNFAKLRYSMQSGERTFAEGTHTATVSIPKEGHALVKLPLKVDTNQAMRLVQDLLTKSEEVYALIRATAVFETPVGGMDVNFEDRRALKGLIGF